MEYERLQFETAAEASEEIIEIVSNLIPMIPTRSSMECGCEVHLKNETDEWNERWDW
jgi:hypothetical protein